MTKSGSSSKTHLLCMEKCMIKCMIKRKIKSMKRNKTVILLEMYCI